MLAVLEENGHKVNCCSFLEAQMYEKFMLQNYLYSVLSWALAPQCNFPTFFQLKILY